MRMILRLEAQENKADPSQSTARTVMNTMNHFPPPLHTGDDDDDNDGDDNDNSEGQTLNGSISCTVLQTMSLIANDDRSLERSKGFCVFSKHFVTNHQGRKIAGTDEILHDFDLNLVGFSVHDRMSKDELRRPKTHASQGR